MLVIWSRTTTIVTLLLATSAAVGEARKELRLALGEAIRLKPVGGSGEALGSSEPSVAAVYSNGMIVALQPGEAQVHSGSEISIVRVVSSTESFTPLPHITQFEDHRELDIRGRRCVGTELNGRILGDKQGNRVRNPNPPVAKAPLEWEVVPDGPSMAREH
jgi:hypothetical protein